jgi:hypothetical protein
MEAEWPSMVTEPFFSNCPIHTKRPEGGPL